MSERKILAYQLTPVFAPSVEDGLVFGTACIMECAATGDVIASSGGGGTYLATDVVDALCSGNLREVFRDD